MSFNNLKKRVETLKYWFLLFFILNLFILNFILKGIFFFINYIIFIVLLIYFKNLKSLRIILLFLFYAIIIKIIFVFIKYYNLINLNSFLNFLDLRYLISLSTTFIFSQLIERILTNPNINLKAHIKILILPQKIIKLIMDETLKIIQYKFNLVNILTFIIIKSYEVFKDNKDLIEKKDIN